MLILGRFSSFDRGRPEAAGDVISGTALDSVGMDVPASFGDSSLKWSNYSTPAGPVLRTFWAVFNFAADRQLVVTSYPPILCG